LTFVSYHFQIVVLLNFRWKPISIWVHWRWFDRSTFPWWKLLPYWS